MSTTTYPRYLERARTIIARTFTSTAIVKRKTAVIDNAGGTTNTYAPAHQYPCSFAPYPVRGVERENTARVQSVAYWQFTFAADADIQQTDRLVIGARTFEVASAGAGSLAISQGVLALEIT